MISSPEMEMEVFIAQLSGRLRSMRRMANTTQEEAARLCGVSVRSYKDYELGHRAAPIDVLLRFGAGFDTDLSKLLFGPKQVQQPALEADLVNELGSAIIAVFGQSDIGQEKALKLVNYAYENSRAKNTAFRQELEQMRMLVF